MIRLLKAPALITGLITSGLGLAVLFGLELTDAQTGGILAFWGAVIACITFVVTPSSEVVAQQIGNGPVKAGAAAEGYGMPTGQVVQVLPALKPPP